jgi:hypothetical protein
MCLGVQDIVIKAYQVGRGKDEIEVLEGLSKPKALFSG